MKKTQKVTPYIVAAVVLLSLGGCAGMSTQDKNTAIGAGKQADADAAEASAVAEYKKTTTTSLGTLGDLLKKSMEKK